MGRGMGMPEFRSGWGNVRGLGGEGSCIGGQMLNDVWVNGWVFLLGTFGFLTLVLSGGELSLPDLGRRIFFDESLSSPVGQSCASCHDPKTAFADLRRVSPGAVVGRVGRRNAPSLMYAALIPPQKLEDTYDDEGEVEYIVEGGLFLDGRAHDLLEQVRAPFFDEKEMNNKDEEELARKLRRGEYGDEFREGLDAEVTRRAFEALVAFLREPVFRPFNARIDDYWAGDKEALSLAERRGLDIFETSGGCVSCHLTGAGTWLEPLLSDSGYDNLGVPSVGGVDLGLGGVTGLRGELGQFKVPTLRNVALTPPYFHNGSVGTLREVMEFYNKRDVERERWGKTDFPETVNREDMGDLGLSDEDISDLVALMDAFTDRHLLEMDEEEDFPKTPQGVPETEERRAFFKEKERPDLSRPRRPRAGSGD